MHVGDPFDRVYANGRIERQPSILFAGQLTEQLSLRPLRRIAVLGVRFHPHGAAALLDAPQHDFVGVTIGVDAIAPPLYISLQTLCDSMPSPADGVAAVQRHLIDRLDPSRCDPQVQYVVEATGRRHGAVSIDALAERVGWTRRHLERRFKAIVGIPPKRLARIARFQAAVRLLERLPVHQRGTRTAAAIGYADQAQFVREFRELAGCPPGAHLLRNAELNGYFSSPRFAIRNPRIPDCGLPD